MEQQKALEARTGATAAAALVQVRLAVCAASNGQLVPAASSLHTAGVPWCVVVLLFPSTCIAFGQLRGIVMFCVDW